MNNATLVAHAGTNRVTELEVRAVPRPAFTDSWHPYSHGEVLDAVGSAVSGAGFKVERAEYSLTKGDIADKMFAVWELDRADDETRFAIGIRNSVNKTMAVGLCAGQRVFVCDNMVFSSSFVLFRKHTGSLDTDELFIMARSAVATVIPQWEWLKAWHDRMKAIELNIREESVITVAAMRRGILRPVDFTDFQRLYHGDDTGFTKYTPTLHGWHGAVTELMNGNPLYVNAARQKALNDFINAEIPVIIADGMNPVSISFRDIEAKADERAKAMGENDRTDARKARDGMRAAVRDHRRAARVTGRRGRPRKVDVQAEIDRNLALQSYDPPAAQHPGSIPETDKQFADRTGMTDIAKAIEKKRRSIRKPKPVVVDGGE